jgi:GntR family transcriptional repressor for pyruvate dehydrogenase complex
LVHRLYLIQSRRGYSRPVARVKAERRKPMTEAPAPAAQVGKRNMNVFRPIKLRKAADVVIAVLADAIRAGLFEPGDLLPSERNLANQLQVSRNVVREAVDVLRRAGIVSVKRGPSGGITVVSTRGLREVIAGLHGETHQLMLSALEARRSLELPAFLLAVARATEEELTQLSTLVEGLEALEGAPEEFYALDQKFHREVVRLAGNPLLADFYRVTLDQLAEIRQEFPVLRVGFEEALRNQRMLYLALRSREPKRVAAAVDEHLAATEVVYLGQPIAHIR